MKQFHLSLDNKDEKENHQQFQNVIPIISTNLLLQSNHFYHLEYILTQENQRNNKKTPKSPQIIFNIFLQAPQNIFPTCSALP